MTRQQTWRRPDRDLWRKLLTNSLRVALGSALFAVAISLLLNPNRLAPGGVSGIAIIISHFSQLSTGLLIALINIPILILGLVKLGWKTMLSTVATTLFSSLLVDLAARLPVLTRDPVLAAVFGGALLAVGLSTIFRTGATTGGADIIVRVLRLKFPQVKSGKLFLIFDSLVIVSSGIVFRNVETALYAALATLVFSFCFDYLLYGGDSAKLIFLISDRQEEIVRRLLTEVNVGVTWLEGTGAYRGERKQVVLCAMKNHLLPKAQKLILEIDPAAFLIIGQASEIFGQGFKDHRQPLL